MPFAAIARATQTRMRCICNVYVGELAVLVEGCLWKKGALRWVRL